MKGMHRRSGKPLDGTAHLIQSISDILSTPIGSRVMRRDYGSLLPELVDAPAHAATRLAVFAATAIALGRWEPRLSLTKIAFNVGATRGQFELELEGDRLDVPSGGGAVSLTVPLNLSASSSSPAFA
jgi:phage baseplate assembly protein W